MRGADHDPLFWGGRLAGDGVKPIAHTVRKLKLTGAQWQFLRGVCESGPNWKWPGRSIFVVRKADGSCEYVHLQNFPPDIFVCIKNVWMLTPRGYAIGTYEPNMPLLKAG